MLIIQLRWLWVMLGVAALLITILVVSGAMSRPPEEVVVVGPAVKTGNPADYLEPPPRPSVMPTSPPTPVPPGATSNQTQPETPRAFTYAGQMWTLSDGPVKVDVESIGKLPDGRVVYVEVGDIPPYDALYLESAPSTGLYHKYVPAPSAPTEPNQ